MSKRRHPCKEVYAKRNDDGLPIPKSYLARRSVKEPKPEKKRRFNSTLPAPSKPMNSVNHERRAETKAKQFGVQAQACRDIRICCHCGVGGITVPHHVQTCGAGGEDRDTVPLNPLCHSRVHTIGPARFWTESGISAEDAVEAMRDWVAASRPVHALPWGRRQ